MKRKILRIIYAISDTWHWLQFKKTISGEGQGRHLYFIDIDNTLADTWPTLKQGYYRNERERLNSLPIFAGMRRYILDLKRDKENKVLFITARNITAHQVTLNWLRGNGIETSAEDVVVVSSAKQKIRFIAAAKEKKINITYIDDLSYNHENGEMKMYKEVISAINSMNVPYLGVEEISEINRLFNKL